jgi:Flp pilus assembly protein TadG
MTRRRNHLASEHGQTAVEFALVAPFIVVLLLAVIQFGMAFHNFVTITDAARAGARKAIVARFAGGNFDEATQAVLDSASNLDQTTLKQPGAIDISSPDGLTSGSLVTVTVKYPYTISIPLLGMTVSSGTLTAVAKERME